jgi:hypothetical protein
MWTWIKGLFSSLIALAIKSAGARGLDDALVAVALDLAKAAAAQFESNVLRRDWVVAQLTARGIPESIARLAVELAVQAIKARQG